MTPTSCRPPAKASSVAMTTSLCSNYSADSLFLEMGTWRKKNSPSHGVRGGGPRTCSDGVAVQYSLNSRWRSRFTFARCNNLDEFCGGTAALLNAKAENNKSSGARFESRCSNFLRFPGILVAVPDTEKRNNHLKSNGNMII